MQKWLAMDGLWAGYGLAMGWLWTGYGMAVGSSPLAKMTIVCKY